MTSQGISIMTSPIKTHHDIPIYLKQFEESGIWLQWHRGKIKYGVRVAELEVALAIATRNIDAMLELEQLRRLV